MATKAEEFRAQQQHAAQNGKPKRQPRRKRRHESTEGSVEHPKPSSYNLHLKATMHQHAPSTRATARRH